MKVMKDEFVAPFSEGVLALPLYPRLKRNLHYLIIHALFWFIFQIMLTSLQIFGFCFHFFLKSRYHLVLTD